VSEAQRIWNAYEADRSRCGECGGWFKAYVPKGGDGSLVVLRPHSREVQVGTFVRRVQCSGSGRPPKAGEGS
jgi:hypothetical protein